MNIDGMKIRGSGDVDDSGSDLERIARESASTDAVEYDGTETIADEVAAAGEPVGYGAGIDEQTEEGGIVEESGDGTVQLDRSEIDESKVRTDPAPSKAKTRVFNPMETQDARLDDDTEGGRYIPTSGGSMRNDSGDASEDGYQVRPGTGFEYEESEVYSMSGFTVRYDLPNGKTEHVRISNQPFIDMESAMASINGSKYLMPVPKIGFKVAAITEGAPEIAYKGVTMYRYIDGKWKRA